MVGCVLISQLKPEELYILSFTAKNVELLGLYPIRNTERSSHTYLVAVRIMNFNNI